MARAKTHGSAIAAILAGLAVAIFFYIFIPGSIFFIPAGETNFPSTLSASNANAPEAAKPASKDSSELFSLDLTDAQLAAVKVEPVEERAFPVEKEAVGSIDFNEDMKVFAEPMNAATSRCPNPPVGA